MRRLLQISLPLTFDRTTDLCYVYSSPCGFIPRFLEPYVPGLMRFLILHRPIAGFELLLFI